MRKRLLLITVLGLTILLPAAAWAEVYHFHQGSNPTGIELVDQSAQGIELFHRLKQIRIEEFDVEGTTYHRIAIPGNYLQAQEGAPNLPTFSRMVAIPRGANVQLEVVSSQTEVFQNINVLPASAIQVLGDETPPVYRPDPNIYQQDSLWPAAPAKLLAQSRVRGVDTFTLGISPFQYNPVQKELIVYKQIHVKLHFQGGQGQFGQDRLRSASFDMVLAQNLLNFDSLPVVPEYTDTVRAVDEYDYVILIPDDALYWEQAERLREFRTEQGIKTGIVSLSETGSTAAEIEAWINYAYNNWEVAPQAFLLLGDWVEDGGTTGITCPRYSDYCADNIYADYDGDGLPDMVFARMPVTAEDIEHVVSKVINYEQYPSTNSRFYDNPLISAASQETYWMILGAEIIHGFMENELGKAPVREYAVYDSPPPLDVWSTRDNTDMLVDHFGPDDLGYIASDPSHLTDFSGDADGINAAINSGAFLTFSFQHANYVTWAYPFYNSRYYNNCDMLGLSNTDLTYVINMNCATGKFDWVDEIYGGESWAEAILRIEGGAVGTMASSWLSFTGVGETLVFGVVDSMYPGFDPGYGSAGPISPWPAFALASAKYYLHDSGWNTYGSVSTEFYKQITYHRYHHFGDAFTMLYTEMPQNLSVDHDPDLILFADSFGVQADAGARIALSYEGELHGVIEASGDWQQMPIFPVEGSGPAMLTITLPNHYRYAEEISVVPACTMTASPTALDISQTNDIQVTVFDESGQEAVGMLVTLDGWGIAEQSGYTNASGQIVLSAQPPYGEDLVLRSQDPASSTFCAQTLLPVEGGTDLGSPEITAAVASINLQDALAPDLEGTLSASASQNEFTLYAKGCGLDASAFSGSGDTAELSVLPTSIGSVAAVIGKPGYNIYQQQVPVVRFLETVSGTVRNPEGEALEGVLVEFYELGSVPGTDLPFTQATTDTQGYFSFGPELFLTGSLQAYLTKDYGYEPLLEEFLIQIGPVSVDFTMQHVPVGLVGGTLKDAVTLKPVLGYVSAYRIDNDAFIARAFTDEATGSYELELPYFEYRLVGEGYHHFEDEQNLTVDSPTHSIDYLLDVSLGGVLIVDDYMDTSSYTNKTALQFRDDLWALGYKPAMEHISEKSDPSLWWNYQVVIWTCQGDSTPLADPTDRSAVHDFLSNGGHLLLEGYNVAYAAIEDNYEDWYLEEVLHISAYLGNSYEDPEVADPQHVLATTPNELGLMLPNDIFSYILNDVVEPLADVDVIYSWPNYSGDSAVLAWDNDLSDPSNGNLVYMSISYYYSDPTMRKLLLENSMQYLSGEVVAPEQGHIEGTALLDGESNHSGISISTLPASSTALTAADGSYLLSDVQVRSYSVIASKDGWNSEQLDNVIVVADETTTGIDFLLYEETTNEAPVAVDQGLTIDPDQSVDITLEASDPDGDPLTYSCVDLPANGTLEYCADGDEFVTYTPDSLWTGTDTFTFKANDGELDSNLATVTIEVSDCQELNESCSTSADCCEPLSCEGKGQNKTCQADELTASASASPDSGEAPLTVNFTGSASGGSGDYSYSWDFGDGLGSSTDQNPIYTYTTDNTYTATLTVDDGSSTETDSVEITVGDPGGCAEEGESCSSTADCCSPLSCKGNPKTCRP